MEYTEPKEVNAEEIKKAFQEAGLSIDKIRKSKLGGYYVYHPFGSEYSYKKYTIIERGEGYIKKMREPIQVKLNFIDNEDLLKMAIVEAKNKKKWNQ